MTADEKVASLHKKMNVLRRVRERQKTTALGVGCVVMSGCLAALFFGAESWHPCRAGSLYSGAMMLFEDAGGYVLAAVIAFMAGVVITIYLMKQQEKKKHPVDESYGKAARKGDIGFLEDDTLLAAAGGKQQNHPAPPQTEIHDENEEKPNG